MDDNKQARENELAIAQINGEIRLVHERIDTIKKNDLYHIQQSINTITKIMWTIGFMVFSHFLYAIRSALL